MFQNNLIEIEKQELALHFGDCKGKSHLASSSSTENPMEESINNPEPPPPNIQPKEADPLWPEAGKSQI